MTITRCAGTSLYDTHPAWRPILVLNHSIPDTLTAYYLGGHAVITYSLGAMQLLLAQA
jgi:hypothetical protein